MYVEYMILVYCHEQEAVNGRVSGRQGLGFRFDLPQVWLVRGEGGRFSISRYFCDASTYFNILCVEYTILVYCHEQEAVRGRVSARQVLGSLSGRPQVL